MSDEAPDPFKNGVSNASGLFGLVKDVTTYLSPAVTAAAQKRSAIQALKEKIGEWEGEAKDDKGRWQQPVLTRDGLETHLLRTKGNLRPSGDCQASFAWAKFLYALNIRPGDNVLDWRQPSSEQGDPEMTGTISLALEGEALCDIINLYQRYSHCDSSSRRPNEFRFCFGTLTRRGQDEKTFVFKDLSKEALKAVNKPFVHNFQDSMGLRRNNLKFPEGTAFLLYRGTLDNWVSDENARLASGKRPLEERAQALLQAMTLLDERNLSGERNWDKPYLITPSWIKEAGQVKKRVTTNGGQDDFLVKHVFRCYSEDPAIVESLKNALGDREEKWEETLRHFLRGLCMFEADHFTFIWNHITQLKSYGGNILFTKTIYQHLETALARLDEQPSGSWGRYLSETLPPGQLLSILLLPHEIVNSPVIILRQDPSEWDFVVEIQG